MRLTIRLPRPGPAGGWSRRARLAFLLVFAVVVSLAVRSVFGAKGLLEWGRLRAEEARLEAEVADLHARLAAEHRAIRELREGGIAVERIARERLGMVKPGEVVYLLPPGIPVPAAGSADEIPPPAP